MFGSVQNYFGINYMSQAINNSRNVGAASKKGKKGNNEKREQHRIYTPMINEEKNKRQKLDVIDYVKESEKLFSNQPAPV